MKMQLQQIKLFFTCFLILFSIIDIIGNAPIIIGYKKKGNIINTKKITLVSMLIFLFFFFLGDFFLNSFGIDLYSFSIAGAIILFLVSLEMIFEIDLSKLEKKSNIEISIIPISFPLIAGPGSVTTLMSLKTNYDIKTIMLSLILNMIFVFFVIKNIDFIEKKISKSNLDIIKKLFGIILLSFSIKVFGRNVCNIFPNESLIKIF
ncbi:MAG: MarC family protein [Candidatus Karelsulcia muelleri]